MNQSTNYNFNLPEGTDLVNLLTQLIPNWSSLDTLLKGVEDQAFTNCTEVVALGVHAITRSNADGKILKWIASANYTAGDTFTVDGNLVSAATASGEALSTNAIVSGAVIIAALNADESAMTIFVTGTNVASDSAKLGGELPAYYAKASDMSDAQSDINDLDNLMGSTSISAIGDGTVTGAIDELNTTLSDLDTVTVIETLSGSASKYLASIPKKLNVKIGDSGTQYQINHIIYTETLTANQKEYIYIGNNNVSATFVINITTGEVYIDTLTINGTNKTSTAQGVLFSVK